MTSPRSSDALPEPFVRRDIVTKEIAARQWRYWTHHGGAGVAGTAALVALVEPSGTPITAESKHYEPFLEDPVFARSLPRPDLRAAIGVGDDSAEWIPRPVSLAGYVFDAVLIARCLAAAPEDFSAHVLVEVAPVPTLSPEAAVLRIYSATWIVVVCSMRDTDGEPLILPNPETRYAS